ncbi:MULTISPECIES: beta-glucosidase [unclassified Agarivorans]|uniref:beta-glucosidase n=1 Tax=unclassified Agarivorans TaxID=2636026 RepID=UPI003D7C77EC
MLELKPKVGLVALAVTITLSGMIAGCNDDDEVTVDRTSDTYYKTLAESMLKDLSISEKLDIVAGPGMDLSTYAGIDPINLPEEKQVDGVAGYINGVSSDSLSIPAVKLADGPAGLRISPTREGLGGTYYATAWPIGTLLASTWNTELVEQVGQAQGNEVLEYGVDILLGPGMNIQRNPLSGRNFEYYSEDPVLSGMIASAMVNGLQSNGIGATLKHFFANNAETNRFFLDSVADPRTLREIYLRGFKIAVEQSKPWAIMSPYNLINGTYVNQRADILTDILRNEWDYTGLVMSDWFAGNVAGFSTDFSGMVGRDEDSAGKQIAAGNNLIEPGNLKGDLEAALEKGVLTEEQVDTSVVAILTQVQKTPSYKQYDYSNNPDLNSHAALAREAAAEGMILLQNNASALPLSKGKSLASFGTVQINTLKGGTGSGDVNAAYTVDIASGLAQYYTLNADLKTFYTDYFNENSYSKQALLGSYLFADEPSVSDNANLPTLIAEAAESNDAAIITLGRQAGEGEDRTNTQGDYLLTDEELEIIDAVSSAFHAKGKTVTVVLNVNGLVDTSQWGSKVDAILLAYMGGQETGVAVADIISGEVNPSGKLAQTIPASYADVPSATTFPGVDVDADGLADKSYYNEGIYVGYRYYTSFDKSVAYPFGYGLSYTDFSYSDTGISVNTFASDGASGQVTVTATISNVGNVAGKEAAQVYVSAPEVKLKKPTIELKAFAKTKLLNAGESQTLSFNISAETLASFDAEHHQWIVEPGTYRVYVSPSSDVSNVAPLTFSVNHEIVISETTPGALALAEGVVASDFITINE